MHLFPDFKIEVSSYILCFEMIAFRFLLQLLAINELKKHLFGFKILKLTFQVKLVKTVHLAFYNDSEINSNVPREREKVTYL